MSYKNVKAHVSGHLRAATSNANSCLGLSCRRGTLSQLLCDMSCIVNDNNNQKSLTPRRYVKSA